MKIIITGATGMVGSEVVRQAILDNEIEKITVIVRRSIEIKSPKLDTIIHENYLDYSGLETIFKTNDACLWCLGISQTQVSKEEYKVITYDYTIAAAEAMLKANPSITFVFLSGLGADNEGNAKTLFGQVKGKAEKKLLEMGFKKLFITRPPGIKPVHKKTHTAWYEKIMIPLYPVFELLAPSFVIASDVLAKSMLIIAKKGLNNKIFNGNELKQIVKTI